MIIGRRGDVLAWNALGLATGVDWSEGDEGDRNTARFYFLDPRARELYPDWDDGAAETVAYLRLAAGRHPDDHELAAQSFILPADPDQMLNTYTAEPGSGSEAALSRLANLAR